MHQQDDPVLDIDCFSSLVELRRGGKVRRYHTSDVVYVENNAEHSFGVALLVMVFYPNASPRLLRAALLHDLQELHVGDLPHTCKRDHEALKREYNIAEEMAAHAMGTHHVMEALTDAEADMLRACDVADAFMYARDEYLRGNFALARQIMGNSILAFRKMDGVLPTWFFEAAVKLHLKLSGGE